LVFFLNLTEGCDPFKICHDPLPGRDPAVEKRCYRSLILYLKTNLK
jgi:hypothetical protein